MALNEMIKNPIKVQFDSLTIPTELFYLYLMIILKYAVSILKFETLKLVALIDVVTYAIK